MKVVLVETKALERRRSRAGGSQQSGNACRSNVATVETRASTMFGTDVGNR